tara:strand:+ start:15819 stop:16940 length:1122 start_codon:yes stop_codon:yes gene_type:complete
MPFTLLRVGPIGLGELIFIIFFLTELGNQRFNIYSNNFVFSRFWIAFLSVSLIGFLFNIIFLDQRTGTYLGMLFDFSSYVVILFACYALENMRKRTDCDFYKIIRGVFFGSSIVFILLYLISFLTNNLLGLPLKYYGFFVPLADNLHQISLFLIPLPFLGILIFKQERGFFLRSLIVFFIGMIFIMGYSTGSFKAMIGFVLGILVYIFLSWVSTVNKKNRFLAVGTIFFIGFLIILLNIGFISSLFTALLIEEDLENDRLRLYGRAIDIMKTSPIFGLGPGGHIWNNSKFYDSHQTFFTVMLQGGIFGLFIMGKFMYQLIAKLIKNPALFAALFTIIVYFLGGDIMRRLPTWIVLVLIFYYNDQKTTQEQKLT